ncbi:F-box domain-containing protein [Mycena kentingensis (nom. inval.)]|nr:F-box domain-containing protein [Mycena kentingensis (nom. inval.)]
MRLSIILPVLLCLPSARPTPTQEPLYPPPDHKLITPTLDAFIRAQISYWNSSGLSLAVVRRSSPHTSDWQIEYGSYGTARADGTPVSPDTLFAIASDSKLFLAAGVGLLTHNTSLVPRLRWDTKIREVLPEWGLMDEEMERGTTVQDMLSHRTGVPRHDLSGYARKGGVSEMISTMRYLRPSTSFREKYQYNNLMYEALSHLQPTLLNQSLESYIAEHIFAPLGMNSSTYSVADAESRLLPDGTRQLAHGFHWSMKDALMNQTGVLTASEYFQRPGEEHIWAGAAGILTSVRDLSTWVAMLLNEGRHPFTNASVIPADVVEHVALGASVSLEKAEFPETSPKVYGCGQNRFSYRGHEIIEHGGSNPGYKGIVTRLPHDQIGIIVLTNDDDGVRVMEPVKFRIIDALLGFAEPIDWSHRYVESVADGIKRNQAVTPRPLPPLLRLPTTPFAQLQGRFRHGAYGDFAPCLIDGGEDCERELQLKNATLRRILAASEDVPTLIVLFKRTFSTYVRLAHFDGNLFNASVIWTTPSANAGEEDVVVGLDRRYLAEWVPASAAEDEQDGWALKGDFWGKEGKVPELESEGRESAEVWFERIS